jgi:hypothetical protein
LEYLAFVIILEVLRKDKKKDKIRIRRRDEE